jgi:hypothetical protein
MLRMNKKRQLIDELLLQEIEWDEMNHIEDESVMYDEKARWVDWRLTNVIRKLMIMLSTKLQKEEKSDSGIESETCRALNENHTTRPITLVKITKKSFLRFMIHQIIQYQ